MDCLRYRDGDASPGREQVRRRPFVVPIAQYPRHSMRLAEVQSSVGYCATLSGASPVDGVAQFLLGVPYLRPTKEPADHSAAENGAILTSLGHTTVHRQGQATVVAFPSVW